MADKLVIGWRECRSALIANELSRLNVDIVAASGARFPEESSLQEHGAGYNIYWSGNSLAKERLTDIGFMIRYSIAYKFRYVSADYSDRIISMHLPLSNHQYAILFNPYFQADLVEKDIFYSDLRSLLQDTLQTIRSSGETKRDKLWVK